MNKADQDTAQDAQIESNRQHKANAEEWANRACKQGKRLHYKEAHALLDQAELEWADDGGRNLE